MPTPIDAACRLPAYAGHLRQLDPREDTRILLVASDEFGTVSAAADKVRKPGLKTRLKTRLKAALVGLPLVGTFDFAKRASEAVRTYRACKAAAAALRSAIAGILTKVKGAPPRDHFIRPRTSKP
jgi:NAD-dependent DNA ligase